MEERYGIDVVVTRSHRCAPVPDLTTSETRTLTQGGSLCSYPQYVNPRSPVSSVHRVLKVVTETTRVSVRTMVTSSEG